jgi:hypothetical protein
MGTVCAAASCSGSTLIQASLCNGVGTCVAGGSVSCAPALCVGATCPTSCSADTDCVTTAYCNAGMCTAKQPLGAPATGSNQCLSGFLSDGVCCNAACSGTCVACTGQKKGGGADGTCGPILAGTDPDNECPNTGVATCGTNGVCDGSGACALYASGTVCKPASCNGNTLTPPSLCNGGGSCVGAGAVSCDPGVCAGGTCQTSCTVDTDCLSSAYCSSGMCAAKQPVGAPATGPNQCLSGFAADGVCCNSACVGTCAACTALKKGTGADGTCGPILAGADPDHECTDQGAASCGPNGTCDGQGACTLYPAGTVCHAPSCQGANLVQPSLCDGNGSCIAGGTVSCAPASCSGGTCPTNCKVDTDCVSTAYCNGTTCTAKQALGAPVTSPNECLSGFLADGVCCDVACAGTCVACTSTKKGGGADGTCGAIVAGTDPDDECPDDGAASCGRNGSCSGLGACAFYVSGTICAPAMCQGNILIQEDLCDGTGSCVATGPLDCGLSACAGTVCQFSCVTDNDCQSSTAFCGASGVCQAKKVVGQTAGGANECLSAFVADGVCCDAACGAGPCDGCTVATGATQDGHCTVMNGVPCDDGDACTLGDTCMAGACVGGTQKPCNNGDQCHDPGACDPTSGTCSLVDKPEGVACDDGNPCTNDGCHAGACVGVSKLDGTTCPGGVCIAGACLLDPMVESGASSSGAASTSGGTVSTSGGATMPGAGGMGGASNAQGEITNGRLVGGGCLSVAGGEGSRGAPAALLLALLALLRRRPAKKS